MADGQSTDTSGDSGGYVHDPDAFRERVGTAAEDETAGVGSRTDTPRNDPPPGEPGLTVPERETFGVRGWVLVGVLLVAFLVVPAVIVFVPPAALPFEVAFLILPLLPAVLLGVVAVWSALVGA